MMDRLPERHDRRGCRCVDGGCEAEDRRRQQLPVAVPRARRAAAVSSQPPI